MEFSHKSIDKLGKRLVINENDDDLNLLQEYRKTFDKPLQNVFSVISQIYRRDCIFAFRIKRLDSIIRKLKRFENNSGKKMVLSRMVDIAGCRCIVESKSKSDLKQKSIVKKINERLDVVDSRNYLDGKASGYKAIHLYVKECEKQIEIQIRTKNQHNWATLVEIIDLLFDKKTKEGEQAGPLNEFEMLFSKVGKLNDDEVLRLIEIEREYDVFKKMCDTFSSNYINVRKQWVAKSRRGYHYFVISAGKTNEIIETSIEGFKDFESAEQFYFEQFLENKLTNMVLIYTEERNFEKICMAYSNYMLATHGFFDKYKSLLESVVVNACKQKDKRFRDLLLLYKKRMNIYTEMLKTELDEASKIWNDGSCSSCEKEDWYTDLDKRVNILEKQTNSFVKKIMEVMPKQTIWEKLRDKLFQN